MEVELSALDPRSERIPEAVAVLARAFWRDAFFSHFVRDPLHEHRLQPGFQRASLEAARSAGDVAVATDGPGGPILGVAAWVPPDPPGSARWRGVREFGLLSPTLARIRHRRTALAVLTECDRRHPTGPHRYLALLGTDPGAQGRGIGGRLLQAGLDRSDTEGVPTYLETQTAANVAWYARFGFTEVGTVRVGHAPPLWLLQREPR